MVSMLVQLGVLNWEEALPVMKHFDVLDIDGDSVLWPGALEAFAIQAAKNPDLQENNKLLSKLAMNAGIMDKAARRRINGHRKATREVNKGAYWDAAETLEAAVDIWQDAEAEAKLLRNEPCCARASLT